MKIFQSAEQNEQLARDAQAILDAEMIGVGFLVDGVSVHPSRVTVLRPQGVAHVRNLELVINRLETISQNNTDAPRTLADEALICARAALAAAPVQPVAAPDGDPVAWMRKRDITELVCCEPEDDGWTPLFAAPAAQGDGKDGAYEFAAKVIELFDDATMRADYMLDAGECASIIRALKSTEIAAIAAKAAS